MIKQEDPGDGALGEGDVSLAMKMQAEEAGRKAGVAGAARSFLYPLPGPPGASP